MKNTEKSAKASRNVLFHTESLILKVATPT